jgi:hypothetical protein
VEDVLSTKNLEATGKHSGKDWSAENTKTYHTQNTTLPHVGPQNKRTVTAEYANRLTATGYSELRHWAWCVYVITSLESGLLRNIVATNHELT